MESNPQNTPKKRGNPEDEHMMSSSTTEEKSEVRQIKKAKRRAKEDTPLVDEDGNELSFEEDSEDMEENQKAVYIDEQDVVQQDSDEWDDDEDMEIDLKKQSKKKKKTKEEDDDAMSAEIADVVDDLPQPSGIWNDEQQPLGEDEELEFDSSAYEMLHRSAVEWPCLSLDIICRERAGGPTGILN